MSQRHNPMSAPASLRLAIVHSDGSLREGLRWLLHGIPEVGRVDVFESLSLLLEADPNPQPHVVLVEALGDATRFANALRIVQSRFPCSRWLVHLEHIDPRPAAMLLGQGVAGFVLRSDSQGFLFDAVRSVADGNMPISARLTRSLMQAVAQTSWRISPGPVSALSKRERELIDGLSRGLRYQDLAMEMGVSIETVRTHVRRAYAKLKVNSRSAAVAKFVRECSVGGPLLGQPA